MKKIFYVMMMALCAVAIAGCEKEDGNGGDSLKINGVDFVGTWAKIESWTGVPNKWKDGDNIFEIIAVTSDGYVYTYRADWPGCAFSNGYLQNCTMEDFKPSGEAQLTISNGKVYIGGILIDLQFEGNDIVIWNDADGDFVSKYQRVLGFK